MRTSLTITHLAEIIAMRNIHRRPWVVFVALAAAGCAPHPQGPTPRSGPAERAVVTAEPEHRLGVLVMAHGGGEAWNRSVAEAVAPLTREYPTALAYGMANRRTLEASLDSLRSRGVTHVAVVRAFLSGASFLDQTAYYLGMAETPPERFLLHHGSEGDARAHEREPIDHGLTVATHSDGLLPSSEATEIMLDRARSMSASPSEESVILIAHGMGSEHQNDEVLEAMATIVARLEQEGFARVGAATLREDWPEARVRAEADIRDFVESEGRRGRRVLVLPMRLGGFGPYADVLKGLSYEPGEPLLPHPRVSTWLRGRVQAIVCGERWSPSLTPPMECERDRTLSPAVRP